LRFSGIRRGQDLDYSTPLIDLYIERVLRHECRSGHVGAAVLERSMAILDYSCAPSMLQSWAAKKKYSAGKSAARERGCDESEALSTKPSV
jgi:hypothetical protein